MYRSTMLDTNTGPFIAFAVSKNLPSGVHDRRWKKVLLGLLRNGSEIDASSPQSCVRHTLTVRSSLLVARNSSVGSKATPLTKPWCPRMVRTRSNVSPDQMITSESRPTVARYVSDSLQEMSVTSEVCPGSRRCMRQCSRAGSEDPNDVGAADSSSSHTTATVSSEPDTR